MLSDILFGPGRLLFLPPPPPSPTPPKSIPTSFGTQEEGVELVGRKFRVIPDN